MAYFSSFLICHLYFRHKFSSTHSITFDYIWRVTVYISLLTWTGIVAFSRFEFPSLSSCLLLSVNGSQGTISDTTIQTKLCGASELGPHLESSCTCVPTLFPENVQRRFLERRKGFCCATLFQRGCRFGMAGISGQMEVVKVSGLDGRPSGRDSGLLKTIDHDNAEYPSVGTFRLSLSFISLVSLSPTPFISPTYGPPCLPYLHSRKPVKILIIK